MKTEKKNTIDVVDKRIYDEYMDDWQDSNTKRLENKPRFPQKYFKLGTIESHRQQKRPKGYKKERPDSVCRPFAGYVHDATNFKNRKWHEEALLKEDGYTESVWLENFPD